MDGAPSKIHLVTKSYLKRWAPHGHLIPVDRVLGRQKPRSPAAVAWEKDWWSTSNPELNRKCEELCNLIETQIPPLLRDLRSLWPLDHEQRAVLTQFTALHVLRTQGFVEWFDERREESLAQYRDRFSDPGTYARFCEQMRSDEERAKKILRMNKEASLIGWMHWTLVVFDEPLLVTSDQPVAPVPILNTGERQEVAVMPARGWANTVEVRFPLSPCEALLGTWYPGNREADLVHGSRETAAAFNGITKAQARRFYRTPECEPAMPPAILRDPVHEFHPISPSLLPGYSSAVARDSGRREQAVAEISRLVEANDNNTLTLAIAEPVAA